MADMQNINFTSKFIIDDSFYKNTQILPNNKSLEQARRVVESPYFTKVSDVDSVKISAKRKFSKDDVFIDIGDCQIELYGMGDMAANDILRNILYYTCLKSGKKPRSLCFKSIIKCCKEILENNNN